MYTMADEMFDGRRFRLLTIVDHFFRETIVMKVEKRFGGSDVAPVSEEIGPGRPLPKVIKIDSS